MNAIDTSRVLTWQYDKAEKFKKLLEAREDVANRTASETWDRFYDKVFDLRTCDRFGLWLWGIILGIPRPLVTVDFSEVPLSDAAYRRVLIARFYWMNADPSMKTAAKYFSLLLDCGEGSSYPYRKAKITDNYDMTFEIELNWIPDAEVLAILGSPDIVNHPTGVEVSVKLPDSTSYLGFDGFWYYADAESRVGLCQAIKDYWSYPENGVPGGNYVSPPPPYYNAAGTELLYDEDTNEYYLVEGGERVVYGRDGRTIYDSANTQDRHALEWIMAAGNLYLEPAYSEYKIFLHTVYDNAGHALTYEAETKHWYYMSGGSKVYYYGQSLSNFDNAGFKQTESEGE